MITLKNSFLSIFLFCALQSLCAQPLAEQFKDKGYLEMYNNNDGAQSFNFLYQYFDEFIQFLQENPSWAQKLYIAKERFIRSKDRNYYSTNFFGFYDESQKEDRSQISFYYSIHFHEFICSCYKEFNQIPQISCFLQACFQIQKPYSDLCNQVATELDIQSIFSSAYNNYPPILLKVIKYLPAYIAQRPHYDGSAFTLFLDSTDNQALLLSPYKSVLTVQDFTYPVRNFLRSDTQNSIVLIPGEFLTEFSIYPTPHIVLESGNARYATIAFAMRPNYNSQKLNLSPLPNFKH